MSRPDLESIKRKLEYGKEFAITDEQYRKKTGVDMPKSIYYTKTKSAVANLAKAYGFKLEIQQKVIKFIKESC